MYVATRADGARPRILVVDDEPAVRRYVCRVLESEGYLPHEAPDGTEAIRLFGEEPTIWDLIISDIVMPRCNGIELQQTIAVLAPSLPMILMSGYATAQLTELGIVAPCGVLVKPFEPDRLLDEVRRCLPVSRQM